MSSFMSSIGPQGRNVEPTTLGTFDVLLHKRLVPYATIENIGLGGRTQEAVRFDLHVPL